MALSILISPRILITTRYRHILCCKSERGYCTGSNPLWVVVIIPILAPLLLQYNDYWTVCYLLSARLLHCAQHFCGSTVIFIFFSATSQKLLMTTFKSFYNWVLNISNPLKEYYRRLLRIRKKILWLFWSTFNVYLLALNSQHCTLSIVFLKNRLCFCSKALRDTVNTVCNCCNCWWKCALLLLSF